MHDTSALARTFREKAELVSAIVTDVAGIDEALAYVVEICDKKDACQLLISGCEAPSPPRPKACAKPSRPRSSPPPPWIRTATPSSRPCAATRASC